MVVLISKKYFYKKIINFLIIECYDVWKALFELKSLSSHKQWFKLFFNQFSTKLKDLFEIFLMIYFLNISPNFQIFCWKYSSTKWCNYSRTLFSSYSITNLSSKFNILFDIYYLIIIYWWKHIHRVIWKFVMLPSYFN